MKRITLATVAAAFAALTISAGAATTGSQATTSNVQQGCPVAPAVANAYLRAQAGKLTMPRGERTGAAQSLTEIDRILRTGMRVAPTS